MKTAAAITVALVLATAALAAAADQSSGSTDEKFVLALVIDTMGHELQAQIQVAQDHLSRYPDWYPLGVRELLLVKDIAAQIDAASKTIGAVQSITVGAAQTVTVGAAQTVTVGKALDLLSAMAASVRRIASIKRVSPDCNDPVS